MRMRVLNPRLIAPQIHPHGIPDPEPKVRHTLRLAKRRVLPRNLPCGGNIEPAVDLVGPRGQDRHVFEARVHADGLPTAQDLRAALAALERL
jgi:hypothetical protein